MTDHISADGLGVLGFLLAAFLLAFVLFLLFLLDLLFLIFLGLLFNLYWLLFLSLLRFHSRSLASLDLSAHNLVIRHRKHKLFTVRYLNFIDGLRMFNHVVGMDAAVFLGLLLRESVHI